MENIFKSCIFVNLRAGKFVFGNRFISGFCLTIRTYILNKVQVTPSNYYFIHNSL